MIIEALYYVAVNAATYAVIGLAVASCIYVSNRS